MTISEMRTAIAPLDDTAMETLKSLRAEFEKLNRAEHDKEWSQVCAKQAFWANVYHGLRLADSALSALEQIERTGDWD